MPCHSISNAPTYIPTHAGGGTCMPTNPSISLHSKDSTASTRFPKAGGAAQLKSPLTWISTICIRLKLRPTKPKATTLSASWTAARMRLSTTAFPPSATLCQARAAVLNSYSNRMMNTKATSHAHISTWSPATRI